MNWNTYSNFQTFYAETKLDGMRATLYKNSNGKITLVNDHNNDKTKNFPEIIQSIPKSFPSDTMLDGEICILKDPFTADFETLLTRQTTNDLRIKLLSQKIPATFVAFDILRFKDQDLKQTKLQLRKQTLETEIKDTTNLKVIQKYDPKYLLNILRNDMEGIILKDPNSTYDKTWLKFRQYLQNDFKVVGVTSDKKLISALELENSKGERVGRVNYTKYPQTLEWKNKVIGMTAVVDSMFTNKGKVRFAVLKELRLNL